MKLLLLRRPVSWLMVAIGVVLGAALFWGSGGQAQDQSSTPLPATTPSPLVYVPPDRGMPGNREGGGARGCGQEVYVPPLIAIIPNENVGRTQMDRPTLLWVAPAVPDRTLIFNINTAEERTLFKQEFSGPDQAEIAGITLPSEAPALEPQQDYHWYLSVVCDPLARSGDVVVDGWVRRVAPDPQLTARLQQTSPQERPILLAEAGLWYDTLAAIAQLRQQDPQASTWQGNWSSLLQEVGLEMMSDLPWSLSQTAITTQNPLG